MNIINDKFHQDKNLYESINDLQINKFRTLLDCCNHLNIQRSRYYYICLKYQLPNVCYMVKQKKDSFNQNGGKLTKNKNFNIKKNQNIKVKILSNNEKNDNIHQLQSQQLLKDNTVNNNLNSNNEKKNNYTLNTDTTFNDKSNIQDKNYLKKIKEIYSYIDNVYDKKVVNS